MNAGFFENLLLSTIVAVIILGVSHIAGEVLVQPTGVTTAAMDTAEPTSEKAETAAAPAAAMDAPLETLLAAADANAGQKLFGKCKSCHTADKGGKNKVGPNLWNIVGQPKASSDGFKYSDALTGLGGNWDFVGLNAFLTNPKAFAKGTKMSFAGMRAATDRAALIVWMRGQSDSPVALP